jgi:hypothetical protein
MKLHVHSVILIISIFISGCVTYPKSQEDQATYHANRAKIALSKGDSNEAASQIYATLNRSVGDVKIKELFRSHPKAKDYYFEYLEKLISEIENTYSKPYQAAQVFASLSKTKSSDILSEDQMRDLFSKLTAVVTNGNISGTVPFYLGDNIDAFPELRSFNHQQIIANRSIQGLQEKGSAHRPIAALMLYVTGVGIDSDEGKRIEALLPTMNIRRDELDVVAKVFPKFAAARKEEITVPIFIQIKNGDRLLSDDILQALRARIRGVEWVFSSNPKITTLVIERLRNDEKTLPERSETITYGQHEVNLLSAAFLMPRNASYLYERISGGSEIEYGYLISAISNDRKIYDEVIRGKVGGKYHRCQNPRIQNAFGGVTSAGFIANDHMKQYCENQTVTSIDELRKEVFSKVVDETLKIPSIKAVHEIN